ncbi:hypothetical protein SDC9_198868 [bioreactor metagenome]|uniref:Uncharacterized protein n=1 Tax=bioreactor metagenome TaxID=1076179 RepID=A0A645IJQ8_9ZZZZ
MKPVVALNDDDGIGVRFQNQLHIRCDHPGGETVLGRIIRRIGIVAVAGQIAGFRIEKRRVRAGLVDDRQRRNRSLFDPGQFQQEIRVGFAVIGCCDEFRP